MQNPQKMFLIFTIYVTQECRLSKLTDAAESVHLVYYIQHMNEESVFPVSSHVTPGGWLSKFTDAAERVGTAHSNSNLWV